MKNYQKIVDDKVNYIKDILKKSGQKGIVYGNSGGKDSVLVGILSKLACENVLGVIMPAGTKRNYEEDKNHAVLVAKQYNIDFIEVDLGGAKAEMINAITKSATLSEAAISNIAPRLRMTTLYAIARDKNYLVAGTSNRSEIYMGYFTKHGDGASDFNPISDLTVTEVYELLTFLKAPDIIIKKPPSAGLYEGQTDELEMGVSYNDIDRYLLTGEADEKAYEIMSKAHKASEHKRK